MKNINKQRGLRFIAYVGRFESRDILMLGNFLYVPEVPKNALKWKLRNKNDQSTGIEGYVSYEVLTQRGQRNIYELFFNANHLAVLMAQHGIFNQTYDRIIIDDTEDLRWAVEDLLENVVPYPEKNKPVILGSGDSLDIICSNK